MEIVYGNLRIINEAFTILSEGNYKIERAISISKFCLEVLEKEFKYYESERIKNCEKYSLRNNKKEVLKNENGTYKIDPEKLKEFSSKIEELNKISIDVPFIPFTNAEIIEAFSETEIKIPPVILKILKECGFIVNE